ncbi:hypothetical protein [Kluyvera intermedia]|uniref:hypothetical protein n=1 Tax=Kluyvera intermedia TaxID=61648 RepID=UPI0035258996
MPLQRREDTEGHIHGDNLARLVVGVLVVTLGIPEALTGAFLLIIRLAISAWETLAAILGTGTAALAAG